MHSGKKDRERARRKVVYDHTHIVSYRRWGVGKRVRLLALYGRNAELAGGLSSSPIYSVRSAPNRTVHAARLEWHESGTTGKDVITAAFLYKINFFLFKK